MISRVGRRRHPLWEEPAGFIASRILDEGYGEWTDLRPVGAGPGFNNGWPRLPVDMNCWPLGPTNVVVGMLVPARWARLGERLALWAGPRDQSAFRGVTRSVARTTNPNSSIHSIPGRSGPLSCQVQEDTVIGSFADGFLVIQHRVFASQLVLSLAMHLSPGCKNMRPLAQYCQQRRIAESS